MDQPKKILFVANVHWFFLHFQLPYFRWLTENGYEVHVAANSSEPVPFVARQLFFSIQRTPFSWKNIKAYFELKKIIGENKYELIHCHTPMGGMLARLAARKYRKTSGLKVLYTAHGFHFYKGAPKLNWLLYYPLEKLMSRFTDGLITINTEDFENTKVLGFASPEIYRIKGVGVNTEKFKPVSQEEKYQLRNELGYSENAFILIYAAEYISRKNHRFIIDNLPELKRHIPALKVIFAGTGTLQHKLENYVKNNSLNEFIDFVGYRTDLEKWMSIADVAISSSRQEGLGLNVAEAMFCRLPVVVTRIRGHVDMVEHGINGLLFEPGDQKGFISQILQLFASEELRSRLSKNAKKKIIPFGINEVLPQMTKYYKDFL